MEEEKKYKKLAIESTHNSLGAKMVSYAGYQMPIQYDGVTVEHLAVRNNVGVFDVSHMGEFNIKGPDSLAFLQLVTSNDVSKLSVGGVQYSCLPNYNGGIVDDLLVYCLGDLDYLLVVNASNILKDWEWLQKNKTLFNVEIINSSDKISLFAIQGPNSAIAIQSLTEIDLNELSYYTFEIGNFAGIADVIISATGYTGSGGYEIYVLNEFAELAWKNIFEAGSSLGIKPIGLGARDTLRLEMGFCLYGNEINDSTSPLEAGLGWITKFNKDFINSSNLKYKKETGVSKKLVAFELIDRGVPRQNYLIVDDCGKEIGVVTSGTMSPSLGKAIGMGYVKVENSSKSSEVFIMVRNKPLLAKIVSLPFWKK